MSDSYLYRNSHGESNFCNSRDMSVCMLYPLVRTVGSAGRYKPGVIRVTGERLTEIANLWCELAQEINDSYANL